MNREIPESAYLLTDKIREIFDDDEYVMMILSHAKTEERIQTVLDFINTYKDVNTSTLAVFVILLDRSES